MSYRSFRNSIPDHPTPPERRDYSEKCAICGTWEISSEMWYPDQSDKAQKARGPICVYCENGERNPKL